MVQMGIGRAGFYTRTRAPTRTSRQAVAGANPKDGSLQGGAQAHVVARTTG